MLPTKDPVVETLQYAYSQILRSEFADPELAIQAAAFCHYGPEFHEWHGIAEEAMKFHNANRTMGNAINAAKRARNKRGIFGSY